VHEQGLIAEAEAALESLAAGQKLKRGRDALGPGVAVAPVSRSDSRSLGLRQLEWSRFPG
jgi:hypothetical protein